VSFRFLGDIVKIKGGKRLPKSSQLQVIKNDHPYIRVRDMGERYLPRNGLEYVPDNVFPSISRYIVNTNDLILSIVGTVGLVSIVDEYFNNASLTENCVKLTGLDEKDAKYLYYYLLSQYGKEEIKARTVGAVQPKLPLYNIEKIQIRWFDKLIREKIVTCLSTLDDKIQLNNQTNQNLESIAQAIFKSWFVDFEPVRAKIAAKQEGKDPERAAMCVISGKSEVELHQMAEDDFAELQATAALFPDELVESELGEVPKGWEVNSLGNICNFTPGSAFKPEYQGQTQGEIPFIKVSDMNLNGNEIFIVKANNYIDNSLQKERKFKLHEEGATVFAKIGVALISNRRRVLTMPTIIDNNMMSASPLKGLSTPYYLYLLLKTIDFNTLVSGTALPYLNVSDLRKILIVHPTINLLNKFELIANPLLQKIKLNSVQCEGLVTLRDNLLPKLLSGEVSVEDIKQQQD
jgi:type I restriction enzyme S subunit